MCMPSQWHLHRRALGGVNLKNTRENQKSKTTRRGPDQRALGGVNLKNTRENQKIKRPGGAKTKSAKTPGETKNTKKQNIFKTTFGWSGLPKVVLIFCFFCFLVLTGVFALLVWVPPGRFVFLVFPCVFEVHASQRPLVWAPPGRCLFVCLFSRVFLRFTPPSVLLQYFWPHAGPCVCFGFLKGF